ASDCKSPIPNHGKGAKPRNVRRVSSTQPKTLIDSTTIISLQTASILRVHPLNRSPTHPPVSNGLRGGYGSSPRSNPRTARRPHEPKRTKSRHGGGRDFRPDDARHDSRARPGV